MLWNKIMLTTNHFHVRLLSASNSTRTTWRISINLGIVDFHYILRNYFDFGLVLYSSAPFPLNETSSVYLAKC
jgi:hypothetical protein